MNKRPMGITLLSCAMVMLSIVALTVQFELPKANGYDIISGSVLFVTALALFLGHRWAWWVTGVLVLFFAGLNVFQLVVTSSLSAGSADQQEALIGHGLRISIQVVVLLYLFQSQVLRFFLLSELPVRKMMSILLGCSALLLSLTLLPSLLS